MTWWPDLSTVTYANPYANDPPATTSADEILADIARFKAELDARFPPPSPEALEQASFLGFFALGIPCCAGADGLRIRVVALEPVTPLDLGVAKLKLERWYPEAAGAIELAAAVCWTPGGTTR
jgi:hypothetical protein